MRILLIGLVLLVIFGLGGNVQAQAPSIGNSAPLFELEGSDGKMHRLADYSGQTVVVAWFPKAFTGG